RRDRRRFEHVENDIHPLTDALFHSDGFSIDRVQLIPRPPSLEGIKHHLFFVVKPPRCNRHEAAPLHLALITILCRLLYGQMKKPIVGGLFYPPRLEPITSVMPPIKFQ